MGHARDAASTGAGTTEETMKHRIHGKSDQPSPWVFKLSHACIVLMHDNPLLPFILDPRKRLKEAGVTPGQTILEVGCGPGFYTLPASEIVGENGRVFAVDVNPYAIRRVQRKAARKGADNIQALCTNAAHTGLEKESVDLAFLFGLPRIAGGEAPLLSELQRVLKPGALLVCGGRRGFGPERIQQWKRHGFSPETTAGNLQRFQKSSF
jgi:SAM-dependent methyltransferase